MRSLAAAISLQHAIASVPDLDLPARLPGSRTPFEAGLDWPTHLARPVRAMAMPNWPRVGDAAHRIAAGLARRGRGPVVQSFLDHAGAAVVQESGSALHTGASSPLWRRWGFLRPGSTIRMFRATPSWGSPTL
jgi:hypothetical protein